MLNCRQNFTWQDVNGGSKFADCKPNDCKKSPIDGGVLTYSPLNDASKTTVAHGASASLTCLDGFTKVPPTTTDLAYSCKTGSWIGNPGSCYQKSCTPILAPIDIKLGIIQKTNGDNGGSKAALICNSGYTSDGTTDATCFKGKWSTLGACHKDCAKLLNVDKKERIDVTYSLLSTVSGMPMNTSKATIQCESTWAGTGEVLCTEGNWNGTLGTCLTWEQDTQFKIEQTLLDTNLNDVKDDLQTLKNDSSANAHRNTLAKILLYQKTKARADKHRNDSTKTLLYTTQIDASNGISRLFLEDINAINNITPSIDVINNQFDRSYIPDSSASEDWSKVDSYSVTAPLGDTPTAPTSTNVAAKKSCAKTGLSTLDKMAATSAYTIDGGSVKVSDSSPDGTSVHAACSISGTIHARCSDGTWVKNTGDKCSF
jgi:hypothetical protein